MSLWEACREAVTPSRHHGELLRMVESQEQVATRELVDDLAEQALLEQLLEQSKPPLPSAASGLDYLLSSPFRYPPLAYGSRFGSRFEPSLFYGALALSVVLAETAFYRLVFWEGMSTPPPSGRLSTEHTLFAARYDAERGLSLHRPPCDEHRDQLTHPSCYQHTQRLGGDLRKAGVELMVYRSARDPDGGLNIALFEPGAFAQPGPLWKQSWLCDTDAAGVSFYSKTEGTRRLARSLFLVDGVLPLPSD